MAMHSKEAASPQPWWRNKSSVTFRNNTVPHRSYAREETTTRTVNHALLLGRVFTLGYHIFTLIFTVRPGLDFTYHALCSPSLLAVRNVCVSLAFYLWITHQSALVCERQHVPGGWRLLKFIVQWSALVLLAGCVKHIKGSLQSWLMTRFPLLHVPLASFNSLPLFPLLPSLLSALPWFPSHPLSLPLLFSSSPLQLSSPHLPLSLSKRCGWMPIILLSDRKTVQDSKHYIFMWYEAHNINYSPLSTHTNTACLCVCMQYACPYANACMTRQHYCVCY